LPGVYEIVWGMSIKEMLEMVGAENVQAVQVAGPSGICLPPSQFDRKNRHLKIWLLEVL